MRTNSLVSASGMVRACMTDLDTRPTMLRLKVDRAKGQASLLYLAGETP